MEKGTSLNSTSLTPKPLASSVYVHVPEPRSPHKRSISSDVPFSLRGASQRSSARSPDLDGRATASRAYRFRSACILILRVNRVKAMAGSRPCFRPRNWKDVNLVIVSVASVDPVQEIRHSPVVGPAAGSWCRPRAGGDHPASSAEVSPGPRGRGDRPGAGMAVAGDLHTLISSIKAAVGAAIGILPEIRRATGPDRARGIL